MRTQGLIAVGAAVAVLLTGAVADAQEQRAPLLSEMTAQQMSASAEQQVADMNEMLKAAFKQLEDARGTQDLSRVTCISDALTPMKGLLKLAERNKIALQEAAARSDRDKAEHEAIKISIAATKLGELDAQVRSCGGPDSEGTVDGRPIIEKVLDKDLPSEDPTEDFKDVDVLLARPVSASEIR